MSEVSGPSPIQPRKPIGGDRQPTPMPGQGQKGEEVVDAKYAFWQNSPWAKMFTAHGALPTAQDMHAIMNGVMQSTFHELSRQEKHRKEVMRHMKEVIEGND